MFLVQYYELLSGTVLGFGTEAESCRLCSYFEMLIS